jgi:hypothetical protein
LEYSDTDTDYQHLISITIHNDDKDSIEPISPGLLQFAILSEERSHFLPIPLASLNSEF